MNTYPAAHSEDALRALAAGQPLFWRRPAKLGVYTRQEIAFEEVRAAEARLKRWSGALQALFPQLVSRDGLIESELVPWSHSAFVQARGLGNAFVKADHDLPIAGSIKARGGVYEVLAVAERIADREGIWPGAARDPEILLQGSARAALGRYTVAVGSTGNLGLSVGLMASALGMKAVVHMSRDAKPWKKDRLRASGATVVEHEGDYAAAVAAGRAAAAGDPLVHFVDDENSKDLFLGYATAALRIAGQFEDVGVVPAPEAPVDVYLPCGVGGAPGGITFGLKSLFGDGVRCFFGEPVNSPSFLLRLLLPDRAASVYDIGLSNRTVADGLAVARASDFAVRLVGDWVDGCYTADDPQLLRTVFELSQRDALPVEPSAAIAFLGAGQNPDTNAASASIFWTTGGSLVPPREMDAYLAAGAAV
jgi:D-serine dehydratase